MEKFLKFMVLGGAGFIGSHLVDKLLARNLGSVYVVDNFSHGERRRLKDVLDKIVIFSGDVTDPIWLKRTILSYKPDVIFNLAAKVTGIAYNTKNNYDMAFQNVMCGLIPLQSVLSTKSFHEVKRFINVSTSCIYPHDVSVPTKEVEGERFDPEPTNRGYGLGKRFVEELAKFAYLETGLSLSSVRPINAAGPRDHYDEKVSHVIPALIRRFLSGEDPVVVWGSGKQMRSFLDPRDFAEGLLAIYEYGKGGETYNLGHSEQISIGDLAKLIQEMTESKAKIVFDPTKPDGYPQRGLDCSKLESISGWKPKISLKETLTDMILEFKSGDVS